LLYNDYLVDPSNPIFASVPESIKDIDYSSSLADKSVEKFFMELSKKRFQARVQPSIELPTMCGNMYCASVYSSLCSIITNVDQLAGKRIGVFSYGSGLASSFFSIRVRGSVDEIREKMDIKNRLANRRIVEPKVYDEVL
jgi:hydroxymethylglutaryl-CoA synthase